MSLNLLIWLVVVALVVLFGWLAARAWRAGNPVMKWGGTVLSGLLTLVFVLVAFLSAKGLIRVYAPKGSPAPDLQVEGTPEQIARGEHLANTFCVSCHSPTGDLPLPGGVDVFADIPAPIGQAISANLTPAGRLSGYTDGEIFRVLREGVDKDRRPLIIMGVARMRYMSDEDLKSVIAYLRSQPAVENEIPLPFDQPNFLAAILSGAGMLPPALPPVAGPIVAPPRGETAEFGEYNVTFQDCKICHGEDLRGGVEGGLTPVGPDLAVVSAWTREQFITTLRTGVDPTGHELSEEMPWRDIGKLDDDELAAIHLYLSSLP